MTGSNLFLSSFALALLLTATAATARAQQQPMPPDGAADDAEEPPAVYVIGAVVRPHARRLKGPLTVAELIALAGGLRRDAKERQARIIRFDRPPGSLEASIIPVDLKAIRKRRAPDVTLRRYDIVYVGGGPDRGCSFRLKFPPLPAVE